MNKLLNIILLLSPLILSGCLRTYYPAIYQTSAQPVIFEVETKERYESKYAEADFTASRGDYENESLYMLRGSYTVVNTNKHNNVNTRLYVYTGIYRVSGVEKYDGTKSIFGVGGEFNGVLNMKINSFKLGFGLSAGIAAETGGYYSFRKRANSEGVIQSEQGVLFPMITLFPVFALNVSEKTLASAQFNVGTPGFITPSVVINNNNEYLYWISWAPDFDNGNYLGRRIVVGFMINTNTFY
ncbi:hypothetical protein MROS_2777 [Melioribacter roseus P3M-2]|uniref:Lipoprotein n=1 Tax=Melioribacter roseus (strain DSM 23840 / JCM 17771 / VKM B-2668 / P3M-2) TaxID=1191523 RepID=I6YZL7_MELRP|nr:hypothetical protein [Melioribacter roseus]AFN76007.1 hypothetical protein MROS_2777 [Melioribacter roseus P3M-2]